MLPLTEINTRIYVGGVVLLLIGCSSCELVSQQIQAQRLALKTAAEYNG